MAMRMPVGNLVYRDVDMSSPVSGIYDIGDTLDEAGWELVLVLQEARNIRWQGGLTDGATLTITRGVISTKYTFRNTPTLPYDIALGPTIQIQILNTVNALNALDPLVDAEVGAIDATDPNFSTMMTIINLDPGVHMDISIATTDYWSNLTVWGPWREGGFVFFSATGPEQPLRMGVELTADGTNVRWRLMPVDFSSFSIYFYWQVQPLRVLKMSADGQQFFTWLMSSSATGGCCAHACVPFVLEGMEPLAVTGVAPNADGGYRVTFASDHGMGDGQNIYIDQAIANGTYTSGINGNWQVTVVSPDTLDLDLSVYAADWTSGTGLGATYKRHSRMFFGLGCFQPGENTYTFRHNLEAHYTANLAQVMCCDSSFYSRTNSHPYGLTYIGLYVLKTANTNLMSKVAAVGNLDAALVPLIGWHWPTAADPRMMMGQLPRTLIVQDDIDGDQTFTHAGFNWICHTDNNNNGALIIALTPTAVEDTPEVSN